MWVLPHKAPFRTSLQDSEALRNRGSKGVHWRPATLRRVGDQERITGDLGKTWAKKATFVNIPGYIADPCAAGRGELMPIFDLCSTIRVFSLPADYAVNLGHISESDERFAARVAT